jgi:hypothetical protein
VRRVAVPRIRELGDDAGRAVLLDDEEQRLRGDDELDLDVLVPRRDEEPRAGLAHALVLAQRELDPVEAPGRRALADELVVVQAAELDRLLLDRLVDRPEENLVLRETLLAGVEAG